MTARLWTILALLVTESCCQSCLQAQLRAGPGIDDRLFVSGDEIASGEWDSLPLDSSCRAEIAGMLEFKTVPSSESAPVISRVPPRNARQPKTTLEAMADASDVLVGRIVRIEAGMSCVPLQVARRIDIEVEEVLLGTFFKGERLAVVEKGGWFDAQGVRFQADESSFYPPAALGDRTLIAGFRSIPGEVSTFAEIVRFRLQGDVIEPAGAPLVVDREPLTLSRLAANLKAKK